MCSLHKPAATDIPSSILGAIAFIFHQKINHRKGTRFPLHDGNYDDAFRESFAVESPFFVRIKTALLCSGTGKEQAPDASLSLLEKTDALPPKKS